MAEPSVDALQTAAALGLAVGLLMTVTGGVRLLVAFVERRRAKRAERAELAQLAAWELEVTGIHWVNPRAWKAPR